MPTPSAPAPKSSAPANPAPLPARPRFLPFSYGHLVGALLAGAVLRLFFILHFPFFAGDTRFYEELARNWLYHGVYGLFINGRLTPVDVRMPGYPAFLALIYSLAGASRFAVMIAQMILDLGTCVLAALIAAHFAPHSRRARVAAVALWLAALCPFTANYTAAILSESPAIFLTTLALLLFLRILSKSSAAPFENSVDSSGHSLPRRAILTLFGGFLLAGFLVGLATLVRPESPLLLAAAGLALCIRWRRPANWRKLALAIAWMAVGLLLALEPWAIRNARTMGRIEFLAPRYAEARGDFMPLGFFSWTQTWMVRFDDAYLVPWKLKVAPIPIETLPASAFDSPAERARVAALLARYNSDFWMTPALDFQFARIARERRARHPLRSYLFIPARRAWNLWFTPRVELLPYSGDLRHVAARWSGDRIPFLVALGFALLNFICVGLALAGAWRCRAHPALPFVLLFLVIRTLFMTQLQTVEPRYLIECIPLVIALAAQALPARL